MNREDFFIETETERFELFRFCNGCVLAVADSAIEWCWSPTAVHEPPYIFSHALSKLCATRELVRCVWKLLIVLDRLACFEGNCSCAWRMTDWAFWRAFSRSSLCDLRDENSVLFPVDKKNCFKINACNHIKTRSCDSRIVASQVSIHFLFVILSLLSLFSSLDCSTAVRLRFFRKCTLPIALHAFSPWNFLHKLLMMFLCLSAWVAVSEVFQRKARRRYSRGFSDTRYTAILVFCACNARFVEEDVSFFHLCPRQA